MARVPQSKPSVPPRGAGTPFQRGPGSAEAFGAGEARTAEERVRAGVRVSEALKAASARVGQQQIAAAQRTGAARTLAVENIGRARAGAVTRVGAARVGATQRTGAAQVGATARTGAAESAAAREAEAITGEAISGVGRALSGVSEDIAAASARMVLGEETLARIEILGQTEAALKAAVLEQTNEGTDFRLQEDLDASVAAFNGIIAGASAKFANQTPQGQQLGLEALGKLDIKYKSIATGRSVDARRAEIERVVGVNVNEASEQAAASPAQIGEILEDSGKFIIDNFGPLSTPEETAARVASMTDSVVRAGFESQIFTPSPNGANIIQAAKILGANGRLLSPEVLRQSNRQLSNAVTQFEKATNDQFVVLPKNARVFSKTERNEDGTLKLLAEGVEGLNLLSPGTIATDDAGNTIAENPIPGEKVVPFTDTGKVNADYAEGLISAPQYADELERLRAGGDVTLSNEAGIRKEFTSASARYLVISDAWDRIKFGADADSGVGDLQLIFSYMKMVEPESSVKEGEFATAENTGGVSAKVIRTFNNIKGGGEGNKLTPEQREEFVGLARNIFDRVVETQLGVVDGYSLVTRNSGIAVDRVILPHLVPSQRGFEVNDYFRDLPDATRASVQSLYDRVLNQGGLGDLTADESRQLKEHQVLWDDLNARLSRAVME